MTANKDLATIAAEACQYLKRDTDRDILLPVNGAPDWFDELCQVAHDDFMPDNWRYEFIQDALGAIADGADSERMDVDSLYPYTADRLKWLASNVNRPGYCDEAAKDMGEAPKDILAFITLGMERELNEVYGIVREHMEGMISDSDEEAEAE